MIYYCEDCKWCVLGPTDASCNRCSAPIVSVKDNNALGDKDFPYCSSARRGTWFVACGLKGKAFEHKDLGKNLGLGGSCIDTMM